MTGSTPVVTDTGPLIHLGEADAFDLLNQFETLLVPGVVFEELRAGGLPEDFDDVEWKRESVDVDDSRYPALDPGETAAIALCRRVGGVLLTDDLDARTEANEIGIEVHGSLGVVLVAYAEGRVDAERARSMVRALERESTLYLSRPLVQRALDRIDDEEAIRGG